MGICIVRTFGRLSTCADACTIELRLDVAVLPESLAGALGLALSFVIGGTRGKAPALTIWNPCSLLATGTNRGLQRFVSCGEAILMLMTKERRTAIRTVRGWAIAVLQEAGAIRECEYHGWMQDRADPHARERALEIARQDAPPGLSPETAAGAVTEILDSIGDTCPECPPEV